MKQGRNRVYCPKCGEEYDKLRVKHKCNPQVLLELAYEEAESQKVSASGNGNPKE